MSSIKSKSRDKGKEKAQGEEIEGGRVVYQSSVSGKQWESKLKGSKTLAEVSAKAARKLNFQPDAGVSLFYVRADGREVEIWDEFDFRTFKARIKAKKDVNFEIIKVYPKAGSSSTPVQQPVSSITPISARVTPSLSIKEKTKAKKDKGKAKEILDTPQTPQATSSNQIPSTRPSESKEEVKNNLKKREHSEISKTSHSSTANPLQKAGSPFAGPSPSSSPVSPTSQKIKKKKQKLQQLANLPSVAQNIMAKYNKPSVPSPLSRQPVSSDTNDNDEVLGDGVPLPETKKRRKQNEPVDAEIQAKALKRAEKKRRKAERNLEEEKARLVSLDGAKHSTNVEDGAASVDQEQHQVKPLVASSSMSSISEISGIGRKQKRKRNRESSNVSSAEPSPSKASAAVLQTPTPLQRVDPAHEIPIVSTAKVPIEASSSLSGSTVRKQKKRKREGEAEVKDSISLPSNGAIATAAADRSPIVPTSGLTAPRQARKDSVSRPSPIGERNATPTTTTHQNDVAERSADAGTPAQVAKSQPHADIISLDAPSIQSSSKSSKASKESRNSKRAKAKLPEGETPPAQGPDDGGVSEKVIKAKVSTGVRVESEKSEKKPMDKKLAFMMEFVKKNLPKVSNAEPHTAIVESASKEPVVLLQSPQTDDSENVQTEVVDKGENGMVAEDNMQQDLAKEKVPLQKKKEEGKEKEKENEVEGKSKKRKASKKGKETASESPSMKGTEVARDVAEGDLSTTPQDRPISIERTDGNSTATAIPRENAVNQETALITEAAPVMSAYVAEQERQRLEKLASREAQPDEEIIATDYTPVEDQPGQGNYTMQPAHSVVEEQATTLVDPLPALDTTNEPTTNMPVAEIAETTKPGVVDPAKSNSPSLPSDLAERSRRRSSSGTTTTLKRRTCTLCGKKTTHALENCDLAIPSKIPQLKARLQEIIPKHNYGGKADNVATLKFWIEKLETVKKRVEGIDPDAATSTAKAIVIQDGVAGMTEQSTTKNNEVSDDPIRPVQMVLQPLRIPPMPATDDQDTPIVPAKTKQKKVSKAPTKVSKFDGVEIPARRSLSASPVKVVRSITTEATTHIGKSSDPIIPSYPEPEPTTIADAASATDDLPLLLATAEQMDIDDDAGKDSRSPAVSLSSSDSEEEEAHPETSPETTPSVKTPNTATNVFMSPFLKDLVDKRKKKGSLSAVSSSSALIETESSESESSDDDSDADVSASAGSDEEDSGDEQSEDEPASEVAQEKGLIAAEDVNMENVEGDSGRILPTDPVAKPITVQPRGTRETKEASATPSLPPRRAPSSPKKTPTTYSRINRRRPASSSSSSSSDSDSDSDSTSTPPPKRSKPQTLQRTPENQILASTLPDPDSMFKQYFKGALSQDQKDEIKGNAQNMPSFSIDPNTDDGSDENEGSDEDEEDEIEDIGSTAQVGNTGIDRRDDESSIGDYGSEIDALKDDERNERINTSVPMMGTGEVGDEVNDLKGEDDEVEEHAEEDEDNEEDKHHEEDDEDDADAAESEEDIDSDSTEKANAKKSNGIFTKLNEGIMSEGVDEFDGSLALAAAREEEDLPEKVAFKLSLPAINENGARRRSSRLSSIGSVQLEDEAEGIVESNQKIVNESIPEDDDGEGENGILVEDSEERIPPARSSQVDQLESSQVGSPPPSLQSAAVIQETPSTPKHTTRGLRSTRSRSLQDDSQQPKGETASPARSTRGASRLRQSIERPSPATPVRRSSRLSASVEPPSLPVNSDARFMTPKRLTRRSVSKDLDSLCPQKTPVAAKSAVSVRESPLFASQSQPMQTQAYPTRRRTSESQSESDSLDLISGVKSRNIGKNVNANQRGRGKRGVKESSPILEMEEEEATPKAKGAGIKETRGSEEASDAIDGDEYEGAEVFDGQVEDTTKDAKDDKITGESTIGKSPRSPKTTQSIYPPLPNGHTDVTDMIRHMNGSMDDGAPGISDQEDEASEINGNPESGDEDVNGNDEDQRSEEDDDDDAVEQDDEEAEQPSISIRHTRSQPITHNLNSGISLSNLDLNQLVKTATGTITGFFGGSRSQPAPVKSNEQKKDLDDEEDDSDKDDSSDSSEEESAGKYSGRYAGNKKRGVKKVIEKGW